MRCRHISLVRFGFLCADALHRPGEPRPKRGWTLTPVPEQGTMPRQGCRNRAGSSDPHVVEQVSLGGIESEASPGREQGAEPDWLYKPMKVAVYLDGMSKGLHGDSKTAQRDQLIRVMLELDGYTVIVIQSRDLDDAQAVRQHLRNIAQAIGRGELVVESVETR